MLELVERVNWNEYFQILAQGEPSIGVQLLVVNIILMGYWFFKRIAKRKAKPGPVWILPMLFIAANFGVVTWGSRLSF